MSERTPDSEMGKMGNNGEDNANRRPVKSKQRFYYLFHKFIWIFPLFIGIWVPIMCIIPYISAIYYQHLEPFFPFVSDAGAHHPQAGYFSHMLDVLGLCVLICTYNRNKQIKYYFDVQKASKCLEPNVEHRVRKLNFLCSLVGYTLVFGIIFIGNFRINENLAGHLLGVTLAFLGTLIYMFTMIYITEQMFKCEMETRPNSMKIAAIIGVIGLIGCSLFSFISICIVSFHKFSDPNFRHQWKAGQPGHTWYVLGTGSEWIAILSVGPFYLCFFRRFYLFSKMYIQSNSN